MKIRKVEKNGIVCAVIDSEDKIITDSQSALDLLMTAKSDAETKNIVINKKMMTEDFFILSTGLAGEILQKYRACRRNSAKVHQLWWTNRYLRGLFTLYQ